MVIYARLEPSEELAIRRAVLEAMASSITFQNTGAEINKLKASKRYAMRGVSASLKRIEDEIEKLKMMLPKIEELVERQKVTRVVKPTRETGVKAKPKERKRKSKYEEELERIRERIAALG